MYSQKFLYEVHYNHSQVQKLSKGVGENPVFFDILRIKLLVLCKLAGKFFQHAKKTSSTGFTACKKGLYSDDLSIYYLLFFKKSGILICISLFAAGRKEGVVLSADGAGCFVS